MVSVSASPERVRVVVDLAPRLAANVAAGIGVAVAAELLRGGAGGDPGAHPAMALAGERLRRVLDHVEEHLAADLSLRELADVAGMEVYRFARAFKDATSLPPHRYVTLARVERATALLRDGRRSISEVALDTGFGTPSHFSATFRRWTSLTPRAYRDASR